MIGPTRRALMVGTAAVAALRNHGSVLPTDSGLFIGSCNEKSVPDLVLFPSPDLAELIERRRRLRAAWFADDINTADEVVEVLYGEPMDALERQITSYQPRTTTEALEAIDFILDEAEDGTAALCDINCGGWGADLYRLLLASRNAIGGAL